LGVALQCFWLARNIVNIGLGKIYFNNIVRKMSTTLTPEARAKAQARRDDPIRKKAMAKATKVFNAERKKGATFQQATKKGAEALATEMKRLNEQKKKKEQKKAKPAKQARPARQRKPKKPPNTWVMATNRYNKGKDKYCIPRKGTPEHAEVRKIEQAIRREKGL
jgi:hypothetical protein